MTEAAQDPHEDQVLVEAVLGGDRASFGSLVERYQGRLIRFLARLLGSDDEAQDVAQEVFIKVYQALDRYDARYRFSTWLFRVGQNAAIDRLRRRRVRGVSLHIPGEGAEDERTWELPADGPDPYARVRSDERGRAVREAVAELPWEYRELILLRHYAELAYAEIAELKDLPLGTVKNKLFRARRMLEEKLGSEWLG
ncbi:MAG: sigma-70 family RNA polymerase sigma factor [Thermoanaerobaculia bacterium]